MQALELEDNVIHRLATAIATAISGAAKPAIPFEIDLWDIATIAAFLKKSEAYVRERYAPLPDFPKAVRPANTTGNRGHALYKATEVVAWAFKYQDKN